MQSAYWDRAWHKREISHKNWVLFIVNLGTFGSLGRQLLGSAPGVSTWIEICGTFGRGQGTEEGVGNLRWKEWNHFIPASHCTDGDTEAQEAQPVSGHKLSTMKLSFIGCVAAQKPGQMQSPRGCRAPAGTQL